MIHDHQYLNSSLNNNFIVSLPLGGFSQLSALTLLNLSTNQITSLTPGMFTGLISLLSL